MKSILLPSLISTAVMLACQSAYADKPSNVFTLGTIAVYANGETAAERTETRISREDIARSESQNIGTALSRTAGVVYDSPQLNNVHRHEPTFLLRGYGLRYVPIYVDNVPVSIPYDGYSDLGRFSTADLSAIQLAKGYSSVMYGYNAMAGVINVTTLKPRSALDVTGSLGYGQGGTKEISANLGSLQQKWYFQAGASQYERRYVRLAEEYRGIDAHNQQVRADRMGYYTLDRKASLKVGYIPNDTDEYVISYSKQTAEKYSRPVKGGFEPTSWRWPEWNRETLSFVSNTWFSDRTFYVKPRLYYDKFDNALIGFYQTNGKTTHSINHNGSYYDDSAFGASVEAGTTYFNRHLLKTLVSYKRETHRQYETKPNDPTLYKDMLATQKFLSIGLEDTITLSDKWEWQLGALYTKRTADKSGVTPQLNSFLAAYPQVNSMLAPEMHAYDLQTAFFYKPTENHTFRATVAKKTRFPSFKEVYSNYGESTSATQFTLQNPGLKAEQAMNYELGYQGQWAKDLKVDISLFLSQAKNAIYRTGWNATAFPGYQIRQNINLDGITERKGIEFGVDYSLNNYVAFGGNYTYLYAKNKSDPKLHLVNMPKHVGNLWVELKPTAEWKIIPSLQSRSRSFDSEDGTKVNAGYTLYNLKLEYRPTSFKFLSFSAGVDNLFNKNYAGYNRLMTNYDLPSAGRYIYGNVKVDFH